MSSTNTNSAAAEPEFRKRVIKTMNKQEAKKKEGLTLLIPQPSPHGHARMYNDYKWTNAQRDRFLSDGTPPFDINSVPANLVPTPLGMWIFDGKGSTDTMGPEVDVAPVPDLERTQAIVVVDFDIPDYVCLIPPGYCRLVATTPGKARLEMKAVTATHPDGRQEHFPGY